MTDYDNNYGIQKKLDNLLNRLKRKNPAVLAFSLFFFNNKARLSKVISDNQLGIIQIQICFHLGKKKFPQNGQRNKQQESTKLQKKLVIFTINGARRKRKAL